MFLETLLEHGTREQFTAWLVWNDPHGIYTDDDSQAEEKPLLTRKAARVLLRKQITR